MTEKVGKQPSDSGIQSDVLDFGGVFLMHVVFVTAELQAKGKLQFEENTIYYQGTPEVNGWICFWKTRGLLYIVSIAVVVTLNLYIILLASV